MTSQLVWWGGREEEYYLDQQYMARRRGRGLLDDDSLRGEEYQEGNIRLLCLSNYVAFTIEQLHTLRLGRLHQGSRLQVVVGGRGGTGEAGINKTSMVCNINTQTTWEEGFWRLYTPKEGAIVIF